MYTFIWHQHQMYEQCMTSMNYTSLSEQPQGLLQYLLQLFCSSGSIRSTSLSASGLAPPLTPDSQVILKGVQVSLIFAQLDPNLHQPSWQCRPARFP